MFKLYVRKSNYRKETDILNSFNPGPDSNTNSVRIFVSYLLESGIMDKKYLHSDNIGEYVDTMSLIPFKGVKFPSLNYEGYETLSLENIIYNMGSGKSSPLNIYLTSLSSDMCGNLTGDADDLLEQYMDSVIELLHIYTRMKKEEILAFVSQWVKAPKNTTKYMAYGSRIENVFVSKTNTGTMFLYDSTITGYDCNSHSAEIWAEFIKVFKQLQIKSIYFTADLYYFGERINYVYPDKSIDPVIPKELTPVTYTQEASVSRYGKIYNPARNNKQAFRYFNPKGWYWVEDGFVTCTSCGDLVRLSFSEFSWLRKKGFKPSNRCRKCRKKRVGS